MSKVESAKLLSPAEACNVKALALSLGGYCPVSLILQQEFIATHSTGIIAEYAGRKFGLADLSCIEKFLTQPERFSNATLPDKIPLNEPTVIDPKLLGDSMFALESTLGEVLMRGLAEVGRQRLCFPTLDPRESALKHLALYLKAHNRKNTQYRAKKYKAKYESFCNGCELPTKVMREGLRKYKLEEAEGWYPWDDA